MGGLTADYEALLVALLPPGPAWTPDDPVLLSMAPALTRLHERILQLLEEADPRTTDELFQRWERLAGLPDVCIPAEDLHIQQRRADLLARLLMQGGLSRAFFIDVTAVLGFVITIDEFLPYRVEEPVEQPLLGEDWLFTWLVNTTLTGAEEPFRVEVSRVEERLVTWPVNDVLECLINRMAPAHTNVLFAYS